MDFTAATADQVLAIRVNAGIDELATHERFSAATPDMVEAIVEGIGQFAAGEWAPLNRIGDKEGAVLANGTVSLPDGFAAAYQAYVEQGWNAIAGPVEHGGQGLPFALAANVLENLGSANMAFSLLPMLTVGAIESLHHHGSPAQQALYLPRLISGEWSGTMNLTEPQAGSDVGALRTTATPRGDGTWSIKGTKIFITWGEHDLSGNVIHLVLARTPGAPAGTRGISLFLVPKYHVNADGSLGARNDLRCAGLEHKLGIMASPTCVMSFGDNDACIGELVGHENEGIKAMFTMMNSARINVGSQGVQIAERAFQQARAYARDRIQATRAGSPDKTPVPITDFNSEQIRAAISGKTFQYTRADGNGFITYNADGSFSYQDDVKGGGIGKWTANGTEYCETFGKNPPECGVFKNTGDAYFAAQSRLVEMKV